jgi:hypothetical protein
MMRMFALSISTFSLFLFATASAEEVPGDARTTVSIQVSEGGGTNVAVQSGALTVKAAGRSEKLKGGEGVHVDFGKMPRKAALLPAPRVLAPSEGQRIGSLRISVVWAGVKGAEKYRLLVSREARVANPIVEMISDQTKTQISVPAPGIYYFRVSAVAKGGLRGRASPVRRFAIDTTPPSLKAGKPEWK